MKINTAQIIENGILINGKISLPDSNTGHIRNSYNEWLLQGNKPEPLKKNDPWPSIRADRDSKIKAVQFEYERYNRELRLNITPTRDSNWMLALDAYVQDLANIPQVYEQNPDAIKWPTLPEN
ncbi:hypothetical protein J8L73_17380 [Pseudoalteromonas sp. MMG006]|uniref:phage tail assembly chaperone n=1 Tax=Pseudoalteromonas sp. MMG006 TaxID=2822683 RepID=UPI001B3971E0|nr:phage tail assembly chaperone [Pseudoalteromonas sp. MMG006]MBQ4800872.1 hypothetical protein [Pseudoalteromonas sp. MMG006]